MALGGKSGFSTISVMVLLSLAGVGAYYVIESGRGRMKDQAQKTVTFQAEIARESLLAHIQNDFAWRSTTDDSSNFTFGCLRTHTYCTDAPAESFVLLDSFGRPFYDSRDEHAGFRINGQACSDFQESGNDACPLRYELHWGPDCASGCANPPKVRVTGRLKYRPASATMRAAVKEERFLLSVTRLNVQLP